MSTSDNEKSTSLGRLKRYANVTSAVVWKHACV